MSYENFKKLLLVGKIYEFKAIEKIAGELEFMSDETNYKQFKYDFKKNGIKYEVKYDGASKKTGNCFIEFSDAKNRASGINSTEADNYIIIAGINETFYNIKADVLKEIIKTCKIRRAKDSTQGYILPVSALASHSNILY